MVPSTIGWLFVGLAIIFLAAAILDCRRTSGTPSLARRAWLHIAIILGLVGVTLQFARLIQGYLRPAPSLRIVRIAERRVQAVEIA